MFSFFCLFFVFFLKKLFFFSLVFIFFFFSSFNFPFFFFFSKKKGKRLNSLNLLNLFTFVSAQPRNFHPGGWAGTKFNTFHKFKL